MSLKRNSLMQLIISAVCLALCMVLPFLTGQIPQIGSALSPMHLPVLLCGFLCGPVYALAVGAAAPTARAYTGPHRKPHSSTGRCMGDRALPICGICPVRKGSTMHRARQTALIISCIRELRLSDIEFSPFQIGFRLERETRRRGALMLGTRRI